MKKTNEIPDALLLAIFILEEPNQVILSITLIPNDKKGEQIVTFTITKGDTSARTHQIIVTGFKTQN